MLVLPPELTHREARACLAQLLESLRGQKEAPVVVEASGLTRFDSSALALLIALRRECLASARPFSVNGLPPKLRQLAGLYGVAELFYPAK